MFKFYLDNIQLNHEPIGWQDFVAQINFNQEDRTLLTSYPNTLIFWGDGYTTIRNQRNIDSCNVIPFRVEKDCGKGYVEILNGLLNLTAVKFNRTKCTAEVQIEDNGIGAIITNNWEINVNFTSLKTKNGLDLAKAGRIFVDFFNPRSTTGVHFASAYPSEFFKGGTRLSYDLKKAFEFLVAFTTDNKLTFRSDWYDSFSEPFKICIVSGRELRFGNSNNPDLDYDVHPTVSLKTLFDAIAKAYNLVMYVDGSELRIETLESIRNTSELFTINNVKNVEEFFDQEILYSKVSLGNQKFDNDGLHSKEILFLTHNKEEYHIIGECNIGKSLDLTINDVIWDTNAIERALIDGAGGSTDTLNGKYDENTFVTFYSEFTYTARAWNVIDFDIDGPWQYNRPLMNDAIAERYNLQGAIAKGLSHGVLSEIAFEAVSTDADIYNLYSPGYELTYSIHEEVAIDKFLFNDDYDLGFDEALQYGVGITQGNNVPRIDCEYTAIEDGTYTFEYSIGFEQSGVTNNQNTDTLKISFVRVDSGNNVLQKVSRVFDNIFTASLAGVTDPYELADMQAITETSNQASLYMNNGDKVYIEFELTRRSLGLRYDTYTFTERPFTFLPGSFFRSTSTPALTFEFNINVGTEYDYVLYRFDKALPNSQILEIIRNPTRKIIATDDLGQVSGYVDNVSMNLATGQSNLQIRSRDNLISL